MKPIVTALCAYGMSGKVFHAPFLSQLPQFHLKSVWQRSRDDAKADYPEIEVVRRYEDLLRDEEIELIVVNTPEPTHFALARQALEAGKQVVVEKAFTPTVKGADALIALAKAQGLQLSVFQNRRWDSDFLTVQSVVEQGLLGRLVEYEAHFDRYRNFLQTGSWKEAYAPGTGILYNLGSHLIDQALLLFGKPSGVFADIRVQRSGGQVADAFTLLLDYEGLKVTLKAGYLVRAELPRYQLLGTEGSFLKYGIDPQEDALKAGAVPGEPGWGEEPESQWGQLITNLRPLTVQGKVASLPGDYGAYYQQLAAALRAGRPLPVTAAQARDVIAVIEAAYESRAQGQQVKFS